MSDRSHLRVVDPGPAAAGQTAAEQLSLAFDTAALVIVLANITNASQQEFLHVLESVAPDVVVELRTIPRFDFGLLSRKVVFGLFDKMGARYHDLTHDLEVNGSHHAARNPAFWADPLTKVLESDPRPYRVLILLDDSAALDLSLRVLPERLQTKPSWQVRRFVGT